MDSDQNQPNEVEISLEENGELELTAIDIDSEGLPLNFSVEGVIRDIDSNVLDDIKEKELKPIAVRLRLLSGDE
ncbi:hypothetical protein [Haloterrigena turkmenica]|uniref:hypothetical protein n=1 Tax=Haloterrigena turkmenica TaxID=62320 RepID=UPI0011D0C1E8|nr:hypothetical protein [Haloterrigena turkmenica]